VNSSNSTNRDIVKTTDTSTNKNNTIAVDNNNYNNERINHEKNKNKYLTLNNTFNNCLNNTPNQNTVRNPNIQDASMKETKMIKLSNQINDKNYKNDDNERNYFNVNFYNNPYKNPDEIKKQEFHKNRLSQKDVSYSEMDDSKISESDKLSSYAPSERTKSKF